MLPMTGMVQPIITAPIAQGVPATIAPGTAVPQGVSQVIPQGVSQVVPIASVPQVMGGVIPEGTGAYIAPPVQQQGSVDGEPINLVLRVRNQKRELNDIRFEFTVGRDTSEGVASELVAAGLVDGRDLIVIAANLDKITHHPEMGQNLTFRLNSESESNEVPDDKALIGFAQLTISD